MDINIIFCRSNIPGQRAADALRSEGGCIPRGLPGLKQMEVNFFLAY